MCRSLRGNRTSRDPARPCGSDESPRPRRGRRVTAAVPLDRLGDVLDQSRQLCLVIRRYERSCDAPALLRPASPRGGHGQASVPLGRASPQAEVGGRRRSPAETACTRSETVARTVATARRTPESGSTMPFPRLGRRLPKPRAAVRPARGHGLRRTAWLGVSAWPSRSRLLMHWTSSPRRVDRLRRLKTAVTGCSLARNWRARRRPQHRPTTTRRAASSTSHSAEA